MSLTSGTPSPSVSTSKGAQPLLSTLVSGGVSGQKSKSLRTPSPSPSFWIAEHPNRSTLAPCFVPGHLSNKFVTPSPSSSGAKGIVIESVELVGFPKAS